MLAANFLAATFNAEDGTGRYLTRTTIFFPYSNIKDAFWETRDLVRVLVLGHGHSAFGGDWRQSRSDNEGRKGWRSLRIPLWLTSFVTSSSSFNDIGAIQEIKTDLSQSGRHSESKGR